MSTTGHWSSRSSSPRKLRQARELAEKIFGGRATSYNPHLSLMYGDLGETKRNAARQAIEGTPFPPFVPEVLEAVAIEGPPDRWPSRMQLVL